jgi:hypothetical protein
MSAMRRRRTLFLENLSAPSIEYTLQSQMKEAPLTSFRIPSDVVYGNPTAMSLQAWDSWTSWTRPIDRVIMNGT